MHATRDDAVREALEDAEVDYVPLLHGVEALHDHLYGEPHTHTPHATCTRTHIHTDTDTGTDTGTGTDTIHAHSAMITR